LGQIEEQLLSDYSYISSPVTSEFPLTPELSPRPPTNTLIATAKSSPSHHLYYYNKQHKKHPTTSSSSSSSHYHNSLRKNNSSHHGNDDDDDDFDKEVATATSSLSLSSPNDHPYQVNVALQSLHEEVNSLYNELTHLNDGKPSILKRVLGFKWMWLFKSIAKHVFFNFIVMLLLFFVLWRRKSPIAYAVLSYSGPKLQALMRFLFNRVVYWKVTV
jgi:hypothetical protein